MNLPPFKESDKVVLIDDNWRPDVARCHTSVPVKDMVYVVREVLPPDQFSPLWAILLVGITGMIYPPSGREWNFRASRFRKLDEIKAENQGKRDAETDFAELGGLESLP